MNVRRYKINSKYTEQPEVGLMLMKTTNRQSLYYTGQLKTSHIGNGGWKLFKKPFKEWERMKGGLYVKGKEEDFRKLLK